MPTFAQTIAFTRFAAVLASLTLPLLSHAAIVVETQPTATPPEQAAAELLRQSLPKLISEADAANGVKLSLGLNLLPELSQASAGTHVVKSTPDRILVSGNTPAATLWAASELCYQLGMRSLLHGDAMPVGPSTVKLAALDLRLSPQPPKRVWRGFIGQAHGLDAWSADELGKLFGQLAKLKFTHIAMPSASAPFASIPLDGDVAGRAVFKGAKSFGNAELETTLQRAITSAIGWGLLIDHDQVHRAGDVAISAVPTTQLALALEGLKQRGGNTGNLASSAIALGLTGDLNIAAHFMSRASCEPATKPDAALSALVTPICGEGVAERMAMGHALMDKAAALVAAQDSRAFAPSPAMLTRHLSAKEPVPAWIAEAKTGFASAMNEIYRANTRARGGARPFILYQAKRLEFAVHWMTAIESLRKAADPAQATTKAESLEAALEATYNAINALGDVARDSSDRGLIALLNQHGLKPLVAYIDAQ